MISATSSISAVTTPWIQPISWQIWLGIGLVLLSALLYGFHYLVFHDTHHIFIYMVGDIAFVPIEVLMVTLIIHKVLDVRERSERLDKLNMVIGAFFDEVGTKLLAYFSDFDPELDSIRNELIVKENWTEEEFSVPITKEYNQILNIQITWVDIGATQNRTLMYYISDITPTDPKIYIVKQSNDNYDPIGNIQVTGY